MGCSDLTSEILAGLVQLIGPGIVVVIHFVIFADYNSEDERRKKLEDRLPLAPTMGSSRPQSRSSSGIESSRLSVTTATAHNCY